MALTPQNNDAFFREVDEELRRDRMIGFARRWGRTVVAAIAIVLVLLGGALWWRARDHRLAGEDSIAMAPAIDQMAQGAAPADVAGLTKVARSKRAAFSASARLGLAATAARRGAAADAAGQYAAIAGDTAVPQPFRDVALLRGTALQFDSLPPSQVIDRLKGLASVGSPWFGSAGEMTALAYAKLGQRDKAGQLLAAIARNDGVPASLRGRAAGLATAMGQTVRPQTNVKG